MEKASLVINSLTSKISSLSVNKEDLYKIFQILQDRNHAAGEIETSSLVRGNLPEKEYEDKIKTIKEGFDLILTVESVDGKKILGNIKDIFESPAFPDQIKSIFVNSGDPIRRRFNHNVANSFVLYLDFSKPDLFNFSFSPSQATPNQSSITVEGFDATWTHGVFNEFNNSIKRFPAKLTFLHWHSVYDLLVWCFGLPFSFWMVHKFSRILTNIFGQYSSFLLNCSYVYVFIFSMIIFRIMFHYARWVWPLIEHQSSRNRAIKHQLILGGLSLAITAAVIFDLIKILFD